MLDPPIDPDHDHVSGPEDGVVLLEYGDFECPYCRDAFPSLQKVLSRMGDQVAFAFRHFPIAAKHPHAEHAAQAAEAAGAQDAFWPMHDALFEHQEALADADLVRYAQELGLDVARFEEELRDGRHAARVLEDVESGRRSGVEGTPAFFIDGERYGGFYDVESLTWALEDALDGR
jgi:protein-disulfide isomerase